MKPALVSALGLVTLFCGVSAAKSPPVKVSLRSSWPAPPFVSEIIEAISSPNLDAFFPLLDLITDPTLAVSPLTLTPEAAHAEILALAREQGYFEQPGEEELVKTALALHLATPKIEAFYQHYAETHGAAEEKKGEECGSWVDWYGTPVCDVETLAQLVGVEGIEASEKGTPLHRPKTLSFDHINPSPVYTLSRPPRSAILYASIDSKNFRELHAYLLKLSSKEDTHVEYIFRYVPPKKRNDNERNYLSGYGVALDLKKMDYLALDDRHSGGRKVDDESTPDSPNTSDTQDHILSLLSQFPEPENATDAKTPLSEDELASLGIQAAHLLSLSKVPLETLTLLSQNFPKYTKALARVPINENIAAELHANSLKAQAGVNMLWLNGASLQEKDVDVWHLARLLRKERGLMMGLESVLGGLIEEDAGREKVLDVIAHPAIASAQRAGGMLDGLFDASDREEGGGVVVWWNDMEKDSRYAKWQPSLYALLRPMYPGALPNIRLNLFNLILVLDLSKTESVNFLAGPVASIMERSLPFRFGLVPSWDLSDAEGEEEDGKKMARLFYYLVENFGRRRAMSFVKKISQNHLHPQDQTPQISLAVARLAFEDILEDPNVEIPEDVTVDFDLIVSGADEVAPPAPLEKVQAYTERLAVKEGKGHAFFNGKYFAMEDVQDFLRAIQMELMQQIQFFQEKVYEGTLSDERKSQISTFFYDLPTTSKRRNKYIFPANQGPGALRIVSLPEVFEKAGLSVGEGAYVYPPEPQSEEEGVKGEVSMSVYVVGNLDSELGLEIVREGLLALDETSKSRISFIHNPSALGQPDSVNKPVSRLFGHLIAEGLLGNADPKTILRALGLAPAPQDGTQAALSEQEAYLQLTNGVQPKEFDGEKYEAYVKACKLLLRELKVESGQVALVVNGRVVGPIEEGGFKAADFKALEDYEFRKRTEPVVSAIKKILPGVEAANRTAFAEVTSMAASIISSMQQPDPSEIGLFDAPQKPRMTNYKLLDAKYTSYELGDSKTALYHVVVLLDPLGETAQRWSSVLKWLSEIPNTYIEIHLNPARYSDVPLKRFYRYNVRPSLVFDKSGHEAPALAVFEGLPVDPIYTLAMDVPTSWLVRPREALYDLDNIQLGHLSPGDKSVDATFELDYIVVEGHAREAPTNTAPRGVQLELVETNDTQLDDTLVMANLGYLQFKAKPGVFKLQIREGRGREVYEMESAGNEGWESPTVQEAGSEVTVTSFEGLTLYPRLRRKPGMEAADVLSGEVQQEAGGVLGDLTNRFMSIFGGRKTEVKETGLVTVKPQADINIFTVASGLLYERFVGIMILSVMRNTKSSVKFWFIENFLSPSFLEFIPHLAEKYNFQYELVTYKWPSWLRAQTEKQRIIWAYKILFLDVLFPMDLKKVIFVDADQIVRADLKDLVDLDLHGAPYGYTPMGDDNTDMEGFRFWKTGYWAEFLKGRPYHISALYVVDLIKFRQMAAGDILRGQYQQLSADPNSLANLDQDLPNNLQREVPIFSLNEDWLWCETWCSKDRLHRAKTIDLCQNPLTKEPKLARARQIPEWEEYDSEIAEFTRKLAEEGKIKSRIATAGVDALAGESSTSTSSPESVEDVAESVAVDGGDEVPGRDEL